MRRPHRAHSHGYTHTQTHTHHHTHATHALFHTGNLARVAPIPLWALGRRREPRCACAHVCVSLCESVLCGRACMCVSLVPSVQTNSVPAALSIYTACPL